MGKIDKTVFKLFILIVFKFLHYLCQDSKFGFCADPDCSVPYAIGVTTARYNSVDRNKLSFDQNEKVTIYVKDYGLKNDLFGVELNGIRGYVPKLFVRETQLLAKATVPANLEFMQSPYGSLVYHKTSHLHISSHPVHKETEQLMQTTVPNNFNPSQSSQIVQHSEVHLQSSRHNVHSHLHTSSDVYIVNNEDSRSFRSHRSINVQTPQVESSSHAHIQSGSSIPLTFVPKVQQLTVSDNNIHTSHHTSQSSDSQWQNPSFQQHTQSSESQWQNPSSQYQATQLPASRWQDPSFRYHNHPKIFSDNSRQNFDPQSNNVHYSQNVDLQSNTLHHTQAPHTTTQLVSQNHIQSSSSYVNDLNDKAFDETMALLQNQGYDTAGEFRTVSQQQQQSYAEKQNPSLFQNVHSQSFGVDSSYFDGNKPSLHLGHNSGFNAEQSNPNKVLSSHLGHSVSAGQSNLNNQPPLHSSHSLTWTSSDQINQKIPPPSVKFNDIQEVVNSLLTETSSVTPTKNVIPQESSKVINSRLAAKIDRLMNLAQAFDKKVEKQEDNNEAEEEDDDDEDYVYEGDVFSDFVSTSSVNTPKQDLNLEMKTELSSSRLNHRSLATKNEVSNNEESTQFTEEPKLQTATSSSSTSLPTLVATDGVNEAVALDKLSESQVPKMEIKPVNKVWETDQEIVHNGGLNISSSSETTKIESSLSGNVLEESSSVKLDAGNVLSEDKKSSSEVKVDSISNDKDSVIHSKEYIGDIKAVDNTNNDLYKSDNESDTPTSFSENADLDGLLNVSDIKETENKFLNAYQTRHLKDVESETNSLPSSDETPTTESYSEFDIYIAVENSFVAIRSFLDALLPWIPDPIYTILTDLEKDGISPRVTVFTVICAVPCVVLMVSLVLIKERSKEKKLNARLAALEKNLYTVIAEKNILEDKLEKAEVELQISRAVVEEEKLLSFKLKTEVESLKQKIEETLLELEMNVDEVNSVKKRESEFVELVRDHEKEHLNLLGQKSEIENLLQESEETVTNLREELVEKEASIQKLLTEKSNYCQANEVFEEKVTQLQKNCNQLLQEAEVWNLRVKELSEKLSQETLTKEELEKASQQKEIEIQSLSEAIQLFKTFEEIGDTNNEEHKTSEGKLKYLKNSTHILMKLQSQEEENKLLSERLSEEKNKLIDMEVSILEVKSENDKLKLNYNQALQDKAEAQTKLEVLTNYFKDKEIQLQKQLGVQEAVRQKTEEGASSAERKINLMEQENSSYKYQVATMKQEMEETERNLKGQIAMQEKKAHENWLAARTAERKLEDTKQEVMQLRQRLTLLEREQENWTNSTREEIIRPVPKRLGNLNDDSINTQDSSSSLELRPNLFPPPLPMMLPPDRPLPPLPPLPPFLPPFDPPPFRPQPWNLPPDPLSNSDFRMTPSDYGRGRESTPPRGRNPALTDGDLGPRQSSPITDLKDSRNSTPPHLLPDFHDIPPHPSRPFYAPPMGPRTRYPMPPRFPPSNFRRDFSGQRRIDNQDDHNLPYGSQNAHAPPDDWHNPNSRV